MSARAAWACAWASALLGASASAAPSPWTITSDSDCPSAEAVQSVLLSLRSPTDGPSVAIHIESRDNGLVIHLGAQERWINGSAGCAERADTVALIVATWLDDLPAPGTSSPVFRAAPAIPASPVENQIGAGVVAGSGGGWEPGARLEFQQLRGVLGWRADASLTLPHALRLGQGTSRWTRTSASLAGTLRWVHPRGAFLATDAGLAAGYTRSWGTGYEVNQSDHALTAGLVAGLRAGVGWNRLRLWIDLRGLVWPLGQRLQVDASGAGQPVAVRLPAWDAQISAGASCVFE